MSNSDQSTLSFNIPSQQKLLHPHHLPPLPRITTQMVDQAIQSTSPLRPSPPKSNKKLSGLTDSQLMPPKTLTSLKRLSSDIHLAIGPQFHPRTYTRQQQIIYYTNSTLRILSLLVIFYVGYVLPFLVVGLKMHVLAFQCILSIIQLTTVIIRLATKTNILMKNQPQGPCNCLFWKNLKEMTIYDWLELISAIPFQLWDDGFIRYHLYYLKTLRLLSLRREFMHFYLKYISDNNVEFFMALITFHFALLWIASIWLDFSDLSDNPLRWRQSFCTDQLSPTILCFVKSIYFLMYTCLTIGYGDVAPLMFRERALMIVFLIMGVIGIAYVVGNFANFFEDKLYTETEREKGKKKLFEIQTKIRKTIDPQKIDAMEMLFVRSEDFLRVQFDLHLDNEEHFGMLDLLSQNNRWLVSQYFVKELGDLELFKKFSSFRISSLIPHMKQRNYSSHRRILLQGTPGQLIFFVKSGTAYAVASKHYGLKTPLKFVEFLKSSCFGQYDLIPTCHPRRFSVYAGESGCTVIGIPGYQLRKCLIGKQQERQQVRDCVRRKFEKLRALQFQAVSIYLKKQQPNLASNGPLHSEMYSNDEFPELKPIDQNYQQNSREDRLRELGKVYETMRRCFERMEEKHRSVILNERTS